MKTTFRPTTALFCVGTALFFGASPVRADEPAKAKHRHDHQTVAKQETVTKAAPAGDKGGHLIPTRDDRHAQEVEGRDAGGANGPEYRVTTGSLIPQRYNRRGYTTDSRDNLFIYDQNDIRLRQSENVSDSLRSVPGLSVGRP